MQVTSVSAPFFTPAAISRVPGNPAEPKMDGPSPDAAESGKNAAFDPASASLVAAASVRSLPPVQQVPQPDSPPAPAPPVTNPPRGPDLPSVTAPPSLAAEPGSVGPRLNLPSFTGIIKETGSETWRDPAILPRPEALLGRAVNPSELPQSEPPDVPAFLLPPVADLGVDRLVPPDPTQLRPVTSLRNGTPATPVPEAVPGQVSTVPLPGTFLSPAEPPGLEMRVQPVLPDPASIRLNSLWDPPAVGSPAGAGSSSFIAHPAWTGPRPQLGLDPAQIQSPQAPTGAITDASPLVPPDYPPEPGFIGTPPTPGQGDPVTAPIQSGELPIASAPGFHSQESGLDPARIGPDVQQPNPALLATPDGISTHQPGEPVAAKPVSLAQLLGNKVYGEQASALRKLGPEAPSAPVAGPTEAEVKSSPQKPAEIGLITGISQRNDIADAVTRATDPAQAPTASRTEQAEVVRQVAERIASHAKEIGTRQISFRLDPPDLGEIHLHITNTGAAVQVRAEAATLHVKTMLEVGQDGLREQLAGYGLNLESLQVMINSRQSRHDAREPVNFGIGTLSQAGIPTAAVTEAPRNVAGLRFFMDSRYIDGLY